MGEILALNWNDINLLTNTIYVTKTVYFVNNTSYINTTKTQSGTRNIAINQKLAEMLKDWKVKQKEKLEEFTKNIDELQIIQSTPITITKNMIDKKFKRNRPITRYIEKGSKVLSTLEPFSIYILS